MPQPYLSLVFPAFNEAERLPDTLEKCAAYLKRQSYASEIIVVDDGSADGTSEAARKRMEGAGADFRIVRFENNHGKGGAVRAGLLEARGEVVLFSDCDLSTPIEDVEKLLPYFSRGCDIVIGSRGLSDSDVRVPQPLHRGVAGRFFNLLVRLLVLPGIMDTQCGFKAFSRKTIEPLTSRQRLDGFAFDVELLLIARRLGFSIKEVPVTWRDDRRSKTKLFRDGFRMFFDLLRIRAMHKNRD